MCGTRMCRVVNASMFLQPCFERVWLMGRIARRRRGLGIRLECGLEGCIWEGETNVQVTFPSWGLQALYIFS
jgi:hypothetical protein